VGYIIQYNPVKIWIAGHVEQLTLYTASLSCLIILWMPWYKRHNLKIDHSGNSITFDSDYCYENYSHYATIVPFHPKDWSGSEIQMQKKTQSDVQRSDLPNPENQK